MTDFQLFITKNELKKKDIAAFLGVSNAFITQLCQGLCGLPDHQLKKIKGNSHQWDVTMFLEEAEPTTPDVDVTALLATIASQQETIATLSRMLEEAQKGKSSDAQLEEDVRCADAGCA